MMVQFLRLTVLGLVCAAQAGNLSLWWRENVPFIGGPESSGQLITLERSTDLLQWQELARVREGLILYGDGSKPSRPWAFYRAGSRPLTSADDWSNQLLAAGDDLFTPATGTGLAGIRFAKFSILLSQPDRVYFQDSVKWPYHYQFAKARLPGYETMTILEYNSQALYANASQRMVLGSVLRAPDPQVREVAVEITGSEAFPADQVVDWIEATQKRLVSQSGWRFFYTPSVEQQGVADANRELFAARGITVDSLTRWATANASYSSGWALGKLVYVPGSEIQGALADGRLGFGDILVTDRVPAELPILAGYVCLQPATPNSHVAILARSLALPFAYANGIALQTEIASLYGREVLLVVEEGDASARIALKDTTGLLTPERRQEILQSKTGGPLSITPVAPAGTISLAVDTVTPADLKFVGGKAANFGFLRRSLPNQTPSPVVALTFDLWNDFLSQTLPAGMTLREHIDDVLAAYTTYPPPVAALRADLAALRALITDVADFTPTQRAAIIAVLQKAGLGGRKIRFRSSTNVEDLESFSGAGLYDSFSGCLEDDLDSDTTGPSHCDPAEPKERGVFRALRKVYASFYNENAFLERLRHHLRESEVGMAVLVHYSTPDAEEMANGVATLTVHKTGDVRQASARIVLQLGAVSITNPDQATRPEVVAATYDGPSPVAATLTQLEASSLTVGGAPVMPWETAYHELLDQLNTATLAWEEYYPAMEQFELDFEFKRSVPGNLGLKQIRLVPHPATVPPPSIP